jgi:hypothetical protein
MSKRATAAQKKRWRAIKGEYPMDCPSTWRVFLCTRTVGHTQPHVGHGADPEVAGFAAWDDAGWYEERDR